MLITDEVLSDERRREAKGVRNMKIGVTERGDAGIDFSWKDKSHTVDGMILITKAINNVFLRHLFSLYETGYTNIIVHATCTGYGSTAYEPNVPPPKTQLHNLNQMVKYGFPVENCVLRIDPIIPTKQGIEVAKAVIDTALVKGILPNMRVRISVLDEYRHVKNRMLCMGMKSVYPYGQFTASKDQFELVRRELSEYDIKFECCAEPFLQSGHFVHVGCVSEKDLKIFGLETADDRINPQNRRGCLCIANKTELLTNRARCPHGCIYCYWK